MNISIQINSLDEALNLQNVAALNIEKYKTNKVEGNQQAVLIFMWRNLYEQAIQAVNQFCHVEEKA
ncbi:hypothetical protein [Vibrio diazotrophicus]|uniref:Uncharacterized protein n=1 Tax=Vibrio diazotrophicus TaxID=685 RepID=A0ABX4W5T3_VIBDI|nr:hypothetical protein [Vibrio diazotrophicus]PNH98452.1 hypothetical protein C1O25_18615 [Vibrio diazotrophicus]